MKRSLTLSVLLVLAVGMLASGCMNTRPSARTYRSTPRAIALSVTVEGVLQPTPAQFAAIQAQAVRQFGAMGYVIVTDLSLAEQILRINFVPNPNDPENSGRATVLGFRNNPYYASAPSNIARPYPASYGFAGMFGNSGYGAFNHYGYGYFGYGSSYYDGYSYSSTTLNPVTPPATRPTHPPHRHDPGYCPPDTPRVQTAFGRFAGNYQTSNPATYPQSAGRRRDHDGPSSGSISSWFGGSRSSSSSSSDYGSSYSRSESSYQRSEPSSSQSAPSYASSYSAPAPSYSSSDSSFSSSSSSPSSSSSSGSSSGSSGTHESSNQHPN